ncbi:MAG: MMPL family transporter [Reyranella sp.]|uniref:MMPL family transporter n=1 Tax=Reyranella sp. TaxID=1929291 RepID=UPI001ACEE9D0|nr:MMPL family transporter [Reyranella sp.]MBN9086563.1 MMPL family transporter [Reyranella sp.]
MSTPIPLIGRIVAVSTRRPAIVVLVAALLTAVAGVYAARHFTMTANTEELISPRIDWRQRVLDFQAAFPQLGGLTMVVVDGKTPELADRAAARLTEALRAKPHLFKSVEQPQGGPFFAQNGLLLPPLAEVRARTEGLARAQPMLAALAADPSLRGVLATLSGGLQGVKYGQVKLADLEPTMTALAETFEKVAAGQPAFLSWRRFLMGTATDLADTRQVILVQPVLQFAELQPGAAASAVIRETARSLGLDPAHGVTVRLTGQVPLADEEFGSLASDADTLMGGMVTALLVILWLSVHSARTVIAMLLTTFIGLVITAAIGLLVIGRFNLISVAFIPLFVGLGVDFNIQYSVRSRAERLTHPKLAGALIAAAGGVGPALALSAAAISVGFFSFLPTTYVGVAELGAIAGLGMVVAFVLTIVLLPALLMVLRPSGTGMAEVGFPMLAPVDTFIQRRRRAVLGVAVAAAVGSLALLPWLRFDFDPLNLKSRTVESMTTLDALADDPEWTPNAISVLAPSLDDAKRLVPRLAALPEVSRTVTLSTFVPTEQPEKLALIGDVAKRLEPVLAVPPRAPPSDAEVQEALSATATALRQGTDEVNNSGAIAARRLADALEKLRGAAPEARAAAASAVDTPLKVLLDQVRAMLKAQPITPENLPRQLVADWVAKDGRVRIQVLPRGGQDEASLRRFALAVQSVAPDATGSPIDTRASGNSVVRAFLEAGVYSLVSITVILVLALRRARDVILTLIPVLLSGLLTFATCAALDLPLNFANIIALPLLFGVGVAFNIYFVLAWRAGETAMLQSSLMRAVVFSALTTATAFGALWLSSHPGTASMGRLLMISLGWELLVTLLVRPALLARPPSFTQ